ncbi:hypothetical protein F441_20387 [Phytophthora nicotianae CJ01A1]|nr:hypothetical protein F443_20506 [Phytophthora nicotianae P1569]ETK73087.1 hypothetical protein L915_19942 [Phytophthora nicotianae]ETL26528.1 hypothetical protein L916_19822 [Phytophthora nicotianae]ETP02571.1 hypothetical protein F441_20387 [Phytophthora nicotianae CJ01A1]
MADNADNEDFVQFMSFAGVSCASLSTNDEIGS